MSSKKTINKYGMAFPDTMDDLSIELFCYSITRGQYGRTYCIKNNIDLGDFKLLTPFEHFIKAVQFQWPNDVSIKSRGYMNTQLLRTIEELCNNDDAVLAGAASMGKCLGKGTPIRMYDGTIKDVENVKVGDLICGDDKTPRQVLSTTSGVSNLYKIVPTRGESWVCNDSHILSLKVGYNKRCGSGRFGTKWKKGDIVDIPIKDYLALSKDKKRRLLQFSVAGEFEKRDIPFDPYCYGVWLGDGGTDRPILHTPRGPMSDYWTFYFESIGFRVHVGYTEKSCQTFCVRSDKQINAFTDFIRTSSKDTEHGREKFILDQYLYNDIETRRAVLAGLLDSDGHIHQETGFEYISKFKNLAVQVKGLAESLGIKAKLSEKKCSIKSINFSEIYYRVRISGKELGKLPLKEKPLNKIATLRDCTATSFKVEDVGIGEYYGFSVDGNHRFLLGNGVVTHNSFPVGLWILLDWCSAPTCTSSWVATTTIGASEDRIWGIISKLWKCSRIKIGNLMDYRHMIVWGGGDGGDQKDYSNAIKALAFPQGNEGQKAIDTTRGRKNSRIRLALDELPEMEMGALTSKVNLSSNDDKVFIGIGNPSSGDNPHTRWCLPKGQSNFESVSMDMDKWETETGVCLFYNGMRSPNFQAPSNEPPPFPFLMDRTKQAQMLRQCYGDENAVDYVRNAIGWWPKSGFAQTILTSDLIRNANTADEPLWSSEGLTKVAGFDTAFTAGGDRCVLTIAKLGYVRGTQNKVMFMEKQHVIQLSARETAEFENQLATEVVRICREAGVEPKRFGMDVSGDGGRVGQAIIREWLKYDQNGHSIVLISSMGRPTDRIAADVDKRPCKDVYDRLVSEFHYSAYHGFKSRTIWGIDYASELGRELCLRRYTLKTRKISIETKNDFKGRIGYSPDCFVEGTLILTPKGQVKIENLKPGDEVITPFGVTKISFIHDEIHNEICKVEFSDGRVLEGKGKHRVFTWEDGWVRLDNLSGAYTIESEERLIVWNILNSLFTTDANTAFKQRVDIIKTGTRLRARDFYIESFGLSTTGLFLMALKSITRMAIGLITELKIWSFFQKPNTCGCICKKDSKTNIITQGIWSLLSLLKRRQKSGTHQKKEESGIEIMHTTALSNVKSLRGLASNAENQSSHKTKQNPSIVAGLVSKMQIVKSIKQLPINVLNVVKILTAILTGSAFAAPKVVRSSKETRDARVLNLVLEKDNVYYANGMLVDNCADSFVYALEIARKNGLVFIGTDKAVPTNRFWSRDEKPALVADEEDYATDDWGE